MSRIAVSALSLLLLLAACADTTGGDAPGAAAPGPDEPTHAPDDLVLRVEHAGGFATPAMLAARLPLISVYGDGRMITQGPQILSYPPPALPNLQVRRLDAAGVRALVDRARTAGIGGADVDYGRPPVADAASTRFTVLTDVVEVYALDLEDLPGLTDAQVRARTALRDLLSDLTDQGAGDPAADEAYRPAAVAAVTSPWRADETVPDPPEVAWPGPALPGERIGPDTGCATATGTAAQAVLAAAADATAITPWRSGGRRWTVALRPLLPDESGCADLRD